jgi:starch phosphorylase
MKVLVNGGINLSELDGWWAEAYTPTWAGRWATVRSTATIPPGTPRKPGRSTNLLEREVIPEFYTRDEKGHSDRLGRRMRESMARLTPRFSADRTVREYTEQHYLPAAAAYPFTRGQQRRPRPSNRGLANPVAAMILMEPTT